MALTPAQKGNTAFQNTASQAKGSDSVTTLHVGGLYPGVVATVDLASGTLSVKVQGILITDCYFMATVGASYLGVSVVNLPPVGSNVLVWYWPQHTYVMGMGSKLMEDGEEACWNPPVTGDKDFDILQKGPSLAVRRGKERRAVSPGIQPPIDMVPGEWAMDTGIGPVIRLLYNFAQMSAGDLAKIETHLLNDMVRIVDNEFRHHHVGGDDLIWSDGWHNTKEMHFTSYSYEAEGKQEENSTYAEGEEGQYEGPKEDEDPNKYGATGRWRLSTYIGFLGDMIHTWVTCPTEVISNTMEEAFRVCNFRQWVGADGTYFIQAGKAVQIEVNPFQVVPAIIKAYHDPNFNPEDQKLKLEQSFLKLWGQGPRWEDLQVSCWQMRAYLRYIPLWQSLARFRQMEANGYCKFQDMADVKGVNPTAKEQDKEQANPGGDTVEAGSYASLSMDVTGNVSLVSGTSSIIMSNGNIQISCPGNLEIKAGKCVVINSQWSIIQALKHISIISFTGGLALKARSYFNALCERGRMWLKSDAKEDQDPESEDYPIEDGAPPPYNFTKCGIVLDATQSKMVMNGAKGMLLESSQEEGHISIQAKGKDSCVRVYSVKDIVIKCVRNIFLKGVGGFFDLARQKFNGAITKFGEQLLIRGGNIFSLGMMYVKNVTSKGGYIGPSRMVGEKKEIDDPEVEDEKTDELKDLSDEAFEEETFMDKEMEDEFKEDGDSEGKSMSAWSLGEWKMVKNEEVTSPDSLKASVMDDFVFDAEPLSYYKFSVFDVGLLYGPRTKSGSYPWPGEDGVIFQYQGQEPALFDKMEDPFTEGNIGGVDKMIPIPYRFIITDEKAEDYEGRRSKGPE